MLGIRTLIGTFNADKMLFAQDNQNVQTDSNDKANRPPTTDVFVGRRTEAEGENACYACSYACEDEERQKGLRQIGIAPKERWWARAKIKLAKETLLDLPRYQEFYLEMGQG